MAKKNKKLIVIGGATASGKTALSLALAQQFQTAILSSDSRQCYKELDIGVAKPNKADLQLVQHYFINTHSIHEDVTAGTFERYGLIALQQIFDHHDVAICVGGTGLYLKALCEGLDDLPQVDTTIKKEIENHFDQKGLTWLQNALKEVDPLFYQQVDINNPMRLLRALSFYHTHQQSILSFQSNTAKQRNFDIVYYAIKIPRAALYERINQRVDEMIELGLLDEVKSLLQYQHLKALQTVGYKELFQYLNGEWSLAVAIDKIKQHTRNYAKRQITWFNNQGGYEMLSFHDIMRKFDIRN